MQELTDVVVVQGLPSAASPGHAVLPAHWTLPSSVLILQAAPHFLQDLQGLHVSVAKSAFHKLRISVEEWDQ